MPTSPHRSVPGDQNQDVLGAEVFKLSTTSATAGANGAVPNQVVGYVTINVGGSLFKVPYFNV